MSPIDIRDTATRRRYAADGYRTALVDLECFFDHDNGEPCDLETAEDVLMESGALDEIDFFVARDAFRVGYMSAWIHAATEL